MYCTRLHEMKGQLQRKANGKRECEPCGRGCGCTEERAEAGEELRGDRLAEREARAQEDREVGDLVRQLVRHQRQRRRDAALRTRTS